MKRKGKTPAIRIEGAPFSSHSLALVNRELCLGLLGAIQRISVEVRKVPAAPHLRSNTQYALIDSVMAPTGPSYYNFRVAIGGADDPPSAIVICAGGT
ncbi:MAG TPA: hypothetical protein VGS41_13860 [Chthonomonadales bacterium]|nr:hypothetical protein [Chthonomonadales bacterium]